MFVATVCNAQVILWDGNDKEAGSDGGFWGRATPTVVEEDGNKCMKFTTSASETGWDKEHCNFALPLGDVDFKGLRRMTMRVKMGVNHNVLVRLVKDGDGGYSTGRLFWCGDANEWNILTFEFGAGPDNEKLTDTGNTVLEIWPFEDGGDALANIGQTVFVDDIKMEGTMVDGLAVRALADNSLTGDVVVTGVIGKGSYQNTWSGDWHPEAYDDYALLAAKLAVGATSLDVRAAGHWDEDWEVIKTKCPGIKLILTDDDMTAIKTVRTDARATDGQVYDITGTRRADMRAKGLYIVDGRKLIVK